MDDRKESKQQEPKKVDPIILEDKEIRRPYLKHSSIKGNVYEPQEPYKTAPAFVLKSNEQCDLSPIDYQISINECLSSLLNACLIFANVKMNPSKLQRLQEVMKILAFSFCKEMDKPTPDFPQGNIGNFTL